MSRAVLLDPPGILPSGVRGVAFSGPSAAEARPYLYAPSQAIV